MAGSVISGETSSINRLVVCVDDDPDMLAAVGRALRPLGYEVITTSEPKDALALVGSRDVGVLVSDYEMPQMNGVEVTSAAKKIRPETVRVLMTGRQSLDTAVEGINQGEIFRYVQKPFEMRTIRKAVDDAFERHLELVASASDREVSVRRERLALELEQEYPNITHVMHVEPGVYEIPPLDLNALGNLGLDAMIVAVQS